MFYIKKNQLKLLIFCYILNKKNVNHDILLSSYFLISESPLQKEKVSRFSFAEDAKIVYSIILPKVNKLTRRKLSRTVSREPRTGKLSDTQTHVCVYLSFPPFCDRLEVARHINHTRNKPHPTQPSPGGKNERFLLEQHLTESSAAIA